MIPATALVPLLLQALSYSSVQATWLPLAFLAMAVDGAVVGVWYVAGYLLNNNGMKASARGEYVQFIGTGIMLGLVVVLIGTVSGLLTSSMSATTLLSPQTLSTMCTNIESYNTGLFDYLSLLAGSSNNAGFSFLSGSPSGTGFPGLCAYITQQKSNPNSDTQVDYPLAAAAMVIANMTNQTAANYQRLYILDAYVGYQISINPTFSLCLEVPTPGIGGPCVFPWEGTEAPPAIFIQASYLPFAGYRMPYKSIETVGTLMGTAIEVFMAQLVATSMFLYIWPLLLFLGFVLRATPFTRKIGGLLIAIALGIVLIYPTVFAIEYLSVGNGLSTAIGSVQGTVGETVSQAYGFNSITANSLTVIDYSNSSSASASKCGTGNPSTCVYTPNFFVEPNLELIAQHYSCWPLGGDSVGSLGAEFLDTVKMLIPFNNAVAFITQLISGSTPTIDFSSVSSAIASVGALPYSCSTQNVESVAFAMFNAYGIIGMSAVLLPLINIMITVTAIIGLSGLFGGDTGLAGLAKLV